MIQVRKSVFETNSSSTHSLIMCEQSDYDKWANGEVYYCNSWWSHDGDQFKEGEFYPKDVVEKYYADKGEERDTYDFCTLDEFCDSDYLEVEEYTYKTKSGEVVHAVAKYGYDG